MYSLILAKSNILKHLHLF